MTDAADVLDVRLAVPQGTDGPVPDIGGADGTGAVPAGARPESPESPETRQLLRELVLRALL